jgi:hypothetical protein
MGENKIPIIKKNKKQRVYHRYGEKSHIKASLNLIKKGRFKMVSRRT